ncbi:MAG: LamG-like jellyroll fold domain-containing protein [Polyangiaceae bacterium]
MNRRFSKRVWILFAGWSVLGSLAAACGSSSSVRVLPDDDASAGQGGSETDKGGAANAAGVDAGGSDAPHSHAGQAGSNDAGASSEGGASGQVGSSSDAGASGADNVCGGCCTVLDCPGDGVGYSCTDHQCINVAGSLSGLLWKLPCTGPHVDISCTSDPTVTVESTLGGASGVTYDVTLHFRGVVERKNYLGGCSEGSFWQSGGADNGDIGNVYELRVSSPPQDYFLNVGSGSQSVPVAIDYVKTVRIDAGATVTLFAASKDGAELFNRDANSTPISVSGTSVAQPFDGQFIQMAVESVTPSAIGSKAAIGGGSSGSALSFSGAQLATVADSTQLRPTSVTQEAWFEFEGAIGGYNAILGKPEGNATNDSYTLWFESGTLRGYVGATTTNPGYISTPWSDVTEWHHAAFTYDLPASRQTLYIDGAVVACAVASGPIAYDTHPLWIGADSDNGLQSGFWNGTLDEVRVFSTARSADQIWADLHTHQLGATPGLVAEWTFDEGSGQTVSDSSGNAQDAVLGSSSAIETSDPVWVSGRQ